MPMRSIQGQLRRSYRSGHVPHLNAVLRSRETHHRRQTLASLFKAACNPAIRSAFVLRAKRARRFRLLLVRFLALSLSQRYLKERSSLLSLPRNTQWLSTVFPNLNDKAFRHHARMSRTGFMTLSTMLENKCGDLFTNNSNCKQEPVSTQLAISILRFESSGNSSGFEAAISKFGFSVGMAQNGYSRIRKAFGQLLRDVAIKWPNAQERKAMCKMGNSKGFPRAIGSIDGTTFSLASKPSFDSESFFDRKSRYSINCLITNDWKRRIINVTVGFPGSVHDARVLRSTRFASSENRSAHFSDNEHLLGDAAFKAREIILSPYKRPEANIPENQQFKFFFFLRFEYRLNIL